MNKPKTLNIGEDSLAVQRIPEKDLRILVVEYLVALGYQVWRIENMVHPRAGTVGVPDLYVFRQGFGGWIELKGTYRKSHLKPEQVLRGMELQVNGIPYLVARSVDDVREWLQQHGQRTELD